MARAASTRVDLSVDAIARICHAGKRALCIRLADEVVDPEWDQITEAQRDSIRDRVRLMIEPDEHGTVGLGAPHHVHNMWLRRKAQLGWCYGPIEDPDRKEHPGFMAWREMPPRFKRRDHLFFKLVDAITDDPAQSAEALIDRTVDDVLNLRDDEL